MCVASSPRRGKFISVCFFVYFFHRTCDLGFGRQENFVSRLNIVRRTGANVMKKQFPGSWEGLKSQKLVQILPSTRAKISQKSQF